MKYMDDIIKIPVSDIDIYHYTSVQSLQGIIENELFWATKSDFLNDTKEFKYTYELFVENILNNIKNNIFREKIIKGFKNKISNHLQLESLSKKLSGFYVISFSTDPDNLALWSEFSNSMGYNLGFNSMDLINSFQHKPNWYGEVIYDKDKQLKCLQEALDKILNNRPTCYCGNKITDFNEETSDEVISNLVLDMFMFCTVYSMFFKQAAFLVEKEYRFVFSSFHESNCNNRSEKMYFRIKDNSLIPYIKTLCKPLNVLKSITIGPKNNIDIAMTGVKCYFREKKIEVPVKKSIIPLRY